MRATIFILTSVLLSVAYVGAAQAAPSDLLAANKAAMGGAAWDRSGALALDYDYVGQGLTGKTSTLYDIAGRGFVDRFAIGPQSGASGFDGANAWQQEPSGLVSDQKGEDVLPLAFNEAYRDGNLWWRAGFGGAGIRDEGQESDGTGRFDRLRVTPRSGKPFEAWFDAKSHLLARTIEAQGSQTITTFYSDYAPTNGVMVARKVVIDDGTGAANRQTQTLRGAKLLSAEPTGGFAQPKVTLHDASLAGNARETTVPFRLVNNHIYAEVSINGSKPLLFIFDTGGHSLLTPDAAHDLHVVAHGAQTATGAGASVAQSGQARVDSIRIGGATIINQPVSVINFASQAIEGVDVKGMVGYEFFARFVTRFDYGAHTITFIDKQHFHPETAGTPVPIVLYYQLPQLNGSYDGISGRFCVDTGNRATLILTGPFAAAHDLRAKAAGIEAMTGWGVGGPTYSFVTHGGVLKLGRVEVDHPLTLMSTDKGGSAAVDAFGNNVGGGVLKRFVVTLDYDHYTMYLKPVAGPIADLDTFDRSGMWINADPAGFKIVNVTKGGPADEAGLKPKDIITAIDGKPASSIALYDLRQRFRDDPPGTVVRLTLKRGNGAIEVRITLRDLLAG